jgi:hypothetical protein
MKLFFLKNKSKVKINPATDDTLQAISSQTNLLAFDSNSNLDVNVAVTAPGTAFGMKNASNVAINPATQETLASVQSVVTNFNFDYGALRPALKTTGSAPSLASVVNVKDSTMVNMNPASDEASELWRRMVKLMEAKATADAGKLKRITVDSFGTDLVTGVGASTAVGVSGSVVPLVTIANDFSENLTGLYTSTSYVGWNDQMYQDVARNAYARSIRSNLSFS